MMALITGASGGLGRAMAVECARRGYDLFLTDIAQAPLEQIRRGIERQYGVTVYTRPCDITSDEAVRALFDDMDRLALQPAMLLNIAGIDYEGGFLKQAGANIARIVQVNIEGTLKFTHAALSRRRKDRRFYIVNVSSLASMYPIPLKATYAASKRFLLDFSIALGQELKSENVSVLALCPGGLMTTQEALLGIAAQGLMGDLTTNDLGAVAHKTIASALSGKRVYMPGGVNAVLRFLGRFVPRTVVARLLYKRWHSAQKKWQTIDALRVS